MSCGDATHVSAVVGVAGVPRCVSSVQPAPAAFCGGGPLYHAVVDGMATFVCSPPAHASSVAVTRIPVPQTGVAVPWGGLDLVVAGAALLLAAAPPVARCPICDRRMPAWRLKEGGCKPCVRKRAQAAVDGLRP